MDDEEVELHEGMPVSNEEGVKLGTLAALLVENEDEDAEFFLLKAGGVDRLIPFEAVLGVGDGALIVDMPSEAISRYPAIKQGADPTDADVEVAYDVYDETGSYDSDED